MKAILLLVLLAASTYSQVSPIWSETPRVDTGNKILVNNHLTTTGTYSWSTSYNGNKTFSSSPWVGLSIRQLRIASKLGEIGFHSYISGSPTMLSFTHMVNTYSPTEIWYLQVCYIASDGSYQLFTDITLTYKHFQNADISVLDNAPGTFRTQNLNTGLTVTPGNTNLIAAFTAGFIGTVNSTYFQANVTEQIVGNNVQLNVTIHPDTVIKQISFYVLRVDLTGLLTRCWIFTQTAITRASYGAQYSFFTPTKVNYATNYISGLRSFSLINNIQYNFTVSGLNFTTYTNSFYNDVSHLNLWVRICPSPYTLFNQANYLCYTSCPAGTYLESADSICLPCYYTCATCTDNSTCVTCGPNRILNATTGSCLCQDYFYEYNGVCVQCHYSCQKCTYSGQYFNCMACDPAMNRQPLLPNNSTCNCKPDFTDMGTTFCSQICGDGKVYINPCDDGNVANDDGCSSTCQEQAYFDCDNPTAPAVTPASQCYFVGDITVKVIRIEKHPDSNLATFFLKIQPFVPKFKDLTGDNMVTNITGGAFSGFSIDGQIIKYNVTYPYDFEGVTIMFGIKPYGNGTFSRFYPKNDTFVAYANNGLHLYAYSRTDYLEAEQLGVAGYIIGFVFSAFAIIFCFGDWKQIGLQLFFSLQICFMTFVIQTYHHPYITKMLQVRNVMGWSGELAQKIPPYHSVPVLEHMGYSVAFQYNFNIMVIFPGVALILYLAYRGALYRHEKLRLEGQTTKQFEQVIQGKILKHFKFQFFVYWMLFNMQQILFATTIQSQYIQNGAIYAFIVACLIGILVCIVALFIRPGSMTAYRAKLFHRTYGDKTFLMVLISMLVMDLLLLLAVLVNKSIFYAMFVGPVIISVYLIARRPFRTMWNNIRLLIIQFCIIAVVALQVATFQTDYSIHKSFPLGIIICMGIIMFVTLVAWIYDIIKKICKLRNKNKYEDDSSKYQSQKEEQSINEKVRQAGYALVHGNGNASRLPTVYEMANNPASGSKLRKSNIQPLKSPKQNMKTSMRQPNDDRLKNSRMRSKLNPKQQQDPDREERANRKGSNYEQLKKRQDTEERTERPSTRRQRINPYQQILNQTASKIK